jgi:hypothetical protein
MVLLDHHATRDDLRIGDYFIDALHFCARHIDTIEQRQHVGNRPGRNPRLHDREDCVAMRVASVQTVEPSIGAEAGRTAVLFDERSKPLPRIVDLRRDHEIAIGRAEHAVQRRGRHVVPRLLGQHALHRVALHRVLVHRHQRVVQRHVDVLAATALYAAEQRGVDRGDRMNARVHIAERDAHQRRRFAGIADHLHDAALRLGDQAKARAMRIGPGMSVRRNRAVHETRIALGQRGVAEAQLVQRTRSIVFDEHIGRIAQAPPELLAARVFHVDADAALAQVELQEVGALLVVEDGGVLPAGIAAAGTLDLDHFGAERREAAAHIGTGEKVAVVDDANSFEGTGLHQFAPGRRGTISRCSPRWTTWPC